MRTLQHKVPKSTPTTAITNYFEDVMEDSRGVGGFVTSDVQGGKVGMLDVGQTSVFDAHFEGSFFLHTTETPAFTECSTRFSRVLKPAFFNP